MCHSIHIQGSRGELPMTDLNWGWVSSSPILTNHITKASCFCTVPVLVLLKTLLHHVWHVWVMQCSIKSPGLSITTGIHPVFIMPVFFGRLESWQLSICFLKLDLQSEEGEIDCAKLLSISLRHCLRLQDRSALSSQDGSLLNRALSIGIEALGEKRYQIASLGGQYHTMTITLSNDCIYSTAMAASFCGTWNSSCPAHRRVLSPITGNHNFLLRLSLRVLYQFIQLDHNVSIEGLFIQ